ncbi:UNVERIFIED_CONTAM: hypothetical protein FKN15_028110 [Acipenser sinensis]
MQVERRRKGTTADGSAERGGSDGVAKPGRRRDGQLPQLGGHPPMTVWQYRGTRAAASQVPQASMNSRGVSGSISHRPGEGSPPESKKSKPSSSSWKPWHGANSASAYTLPNQEAQMVAEALTEVFFSWFGVQQELHSDQARNFESKVFSNICKRLGITFTRVGACPPPGLGFAIPPLSNN